MTFLFRNDAGFTLLEILVATALIAVLSGVAALSLSGDATRDARREAETLLRALQQAADAAVYEGSETGAAFTATGYAFLRYDPAARQWRSAAQAGLGARRLPADLRLSGNIAGLPLRFAAEEDLRPAILFLSSGEVTGFSLTLADADRKSAVTLGTDGLAPIRFLDDAP